MFNTPRVLGGFPILALHPKSLRQIGELGVFGTNSGSVNEPLMGGSFCVGNGVGIEVLAKSIFVRGYAPSMAGAPCTRGALTPSMEAALPPPSMAVCLAPVLAPHSIAHPAPAGVGCGGIRGWRRTSKRSFGGKRASAPKIIRGLSYLRLDS